jgi:general secretion pathway protein L
MIKTAVGIEVSGNSLRIAITRSSFGKLRVLRYSEIPGFTELSPEDCRAALSKVVKEYRVPTSRVFLSLPREQGLVRQLELPSEIGDKLKSAVGLQLESLCPWPVEDVYWDFSHDSSRSVGKFVTVSVVIIPRTVLDPWIELLRSVRLPLSGASLSSLSCAHAVTALWRDAAPTLVLNCETNYVEGSVVVGSRIGSVTLKGDTTAEHARAAVEHLVSQARIDSSAETRVLVYGPAASVLDGANNVSLPVEEASAKAPFAFGAIAASMAGIRKTFFGTNLVPTALRHRQNQLQLVPTYVLVLLAVALGILLIAREPYQLAAYASILDAEIQKLTPVARDVSLQETQLNNLSAKHRTLTSHFQNRDSNLEVLRELSRALPDAAWLSSYSYQDGAITISGFADASSEVQRIVEDSPLFKDALFTSPVSRDASGKDRFTLKATVEVPR